MATIEDILAQKRDEGGQVLKGITQPNESGFESVLRTLGLGGYGVRNILTGNLEGAGRNLVDLLTSPVRAVLPGDQSSWELSRRSEGEGTPNDLPEGSDLVGGMEPGFGKLAADIGLGLLTDPLTYLGVGAIGAGGKVATGAAQAAKGAEAGRKALTLGIPFVPSTRVAIPGSEKLLEGIGAGAKAAYGSLPEGARTGLETAAKNTRSVFGARRVDPEIAPILEAGKAAGKVSTQAGQDWVAETLRGVPRDQQAILMQAIQGVTREGGLANAGGKAAAIGEDAANPAYAMTKEVIDRLGSRAREGGLPASEVWKLVRKEETIPGRIGILEEALGLGGVAVPKLQGDVLEMVARDPDRMWDMVFNPQWADDAARVTRESAIPDATQGALYASGVDIANQAMMGGRVAKLAPDKLVGGKPIAPSPIADASGIAASNAELLTQRPFEIGSVDAMLGKVNRPAISRTGAQMADPLDVVNMQQGGAIAPLAKVGADELPSLTSRFKYIDDIKADIISNLTRAGATPDVVAKLTPVVNEIAEGMSRQFRELVDAKAFSRPIGRDLLRESPQYMQRVFSGMDTEVDESIRKLTGAPQASKARTIKDTESLADYLNSHPDVTLDDFLAKVMAKRAGQQGGMIAKAKIAQGLVEKFAKQADEKVSVAMKTVPEWEYLPAAEKATMAGLTEAEAAAQAARGMPLFTPGGKSDLADAANKIIAQIKKVDPETADEIEAVYRGIAPRGALMDVIAKGNRLFKPFATAGAFIPRINFTVRNVMTGGLFQVLANEKARAIWPQMAKKAAGIILRSIDDGIEYLTGRRFGPNELDEINNAFKTGGGTIDGVLAKIQDPIAREAVQLGVVSDGFAQAELLADQIARTGWSKKWRDMRDWPAAIAGGSEKRMRYAAFRALRDKGIDPEEAARVVKDTFFDYDVSSAGNRTARDIIPFFQFSAKAIPQSAKFFAQNPGAMAAVRPLYTQDTADNPIYPYMQGQVNIPMGEDEEGNQSYLSSLGLPFEVLSDIPNLSNSPLDVLRELRQGVVGQATPPLKTAFAALSGVDPYFGTPFMSYDKAPEALQAVGVPERGDVGRYYNALAGTGLIQPLASPVQYASQIMDDRRTPLESLLGATTGLRVTSVDEDRALQQAITDLLRSRPDVGQYLTYYQNSEDPEIQALLSALGGAKKRLREKREAVAVE